jgi:hypothetical protein
MEQKKVELLSFELKDYKIIRVVRLDFEKWKENQIVELVGEIGQGKSSITEGMSMALNGVDAIKDKDLLDLGFKSEVSLADGEHKLFLGMKVSEVTRGDRKGEKKFETFLYEKDIEGKIITSPVIDGKKYSAKEYCDMLSTPLTFRMPDLFSGNQTTHRKLIEDLFSEELGKLGVDEILTRIKTKKETRDNARHERDRAAATMESFTEGGYKEEDLAKLIEIPEKPIEEKISQLKIDKGVLTASPEKELEIELNKIIEKGRVVVEKIRAINETNKAANDKAKEDWKKLEEAYEYDNEDWTLASSAFNNLSMPKNYHTEFSLIFDKWRSEIRKQHDVYFNGKAPEDKKTLTITDGKLIITQEEEMPIEYAKLVLEYKAIGKGYLKKKNAGAIVPSTEDIDKKIEAAENELTAASFNNGLFNRFRLWKEWITASGEYDKEVDSLRKLYTKINTGVKGLVIVPGFTESGKLEIWMEYDGVQDAEFFMNKKKESRRLYEYSHSQRAVIGVFLQAARLDKKEKVLRLVVLDEATQTKKGKDLLEKLCIEKDLKLIITKTDDRIKQEDLGDGMVLIENGEVLL